MKRSEECGTDKEKCRKCKLNFTDENSKIKMSRYRSRIDMLSVDSVYLGTLLTTVRRNPEIAELIDNNVPITSRFDNYNLDV
jgi:hypothetical protein